MIFHGFSPTLLAETGIPDIGVCWWRPGLIKNAVYLKMSVKEALLTVLAKSGVWLIDGGWGGPPGPIAIMWTGDGWANLGYFAKYTWPSNGVQELFSD